MARRKREEDEDDDDDAALSPRRIRRTARAVGTRLLEKETERSAIAIQKEIDKRDV
jgi:hypothetical protein